jgi:hypothetical protein
MNPRTALPVLIVLGLSALPAAAIGFTDYGGPVRGQFQRIEREGQGDPAAAKLVKVAVKAVALMENPKLEGSYAAELSGLSKVAKSAEKSFAGDAALNGRLAALVELYASEIDAARTSLAADAGGNAASAKALAQVDKALARVTPEMPASAKLKGYAKAAKALGAWLAPGTVERELQFVVSGVSVAPPASSFDFDGDLDPDCALEAARLYLAGTGFDLNAALSTFVLSRPTVTGLWLWGVQDLEDDAEVWFSILNGQDPDGSTLDNFLGYEAFLIALAPSPVDNRPNRRGMAPVTAGGAFEVTMSGESFDFGGLQVTVEWPTWFRGTASSSSVSGVLGATVLAESLLSWLELAGMPSEERDNVLAFADLDTDHDMVNDAFSCAFSISSVPAIIFLP